MTNSGLNIFIGAGIYPEDIKKAQSGYHTLFFFRDGH